MTLSCRLSSKLSVVDKILATFILECMGRRAPGSMMQETEGGGLSRVCMTFVKVLTPSLNQGPGLKKSENIPGFLNFSNVLCRGWSVCWIIGMLCGIMCVTSSADLYNSLPFFCKIAAAMDYLRGDHQSERYRSTQKVATIRRHFG